MAKTSAPMSLFPSTWISENGIAHHIEGMDKFLIRNAMRKLLIQASQRMVQDLKDGYENLTPAYGYSRMLIEEQRLKQMAMRSIHSYARQTPIYAALDDEAKRQDFDPFNQDCDGYSVEHEMKVVKHRNKVASLIDAG